jgi:hypothetical protein
MKQESAIAGMVTHFQSESHAKGFTVKDIHMVPWFETSTCRFTPPLLKEESFHIIQNKLVSCQDGAQSPIPTAQNPTFFL